MLFTLGLYILYLQCTQREIKVNCYYQTKYRIKQYSPQVTTYHICNIPRGKTKFIIIFKLSACLKLKLLRSLSLWAVALDPPLYINPNFMTQVCCKFSSFKCVCFFNKDEMFFIFQVSYSQLKDRRRLCKNESQPFKMMLTRAFL